MPTFTAADFQNATEGAGGDVGGEDQVRSAIEGGIEAEPTIEDPTLEDEGGDPASDPADTADAPAAAPDPYADFRFEGDDVPEELRGRSPAEALQTYRALQTIARQLAAAQQQPAQTAQSLPAVEITEDDLGYSADPKVLQGKIEQLLAAKTQPYIQSLHQQQSMSNYQQARTTLPHFQRYEQEILQHAQQLNVEQTANPQTWVWLHNQVAAMHMDEIIADKIKEATAAASAAPARPAAPVTERGSAPAPNGGKSKKPDLSPEELAVVRGLGITPEQFVKQRQKMAGATT